MPAHTIEELAANRRIRRLIHFTPAANLQSIMTRGLVSQKHARNVGLPIIANDEMRIDGHLNALSLSVTLPNYKMFYKCRQKDKQVDWAVLTIDRNSSVAKRCAFYTTNAAHASMSSLNPIHLTSAASFEAMFKESEERENELLEKWDTTDVQAEVLVFDKIEPNLIKNIYFYDDATKNKYIEVCNGLKPKAANLLYSQRRFIRERVKD